MALKDPFANGEHTALFQAITSPPQPKHIDPHDDYMNKVRQLLAWNAEPDDDEYTP